MNLNFLKEKKAFVRDHLTQLNDKLQMNSVPISVT